jgi:2-(1,2-epoxy-1,2-dihydrophenyl)acetyl-CoA isomerase
MARDELPFRSLDVVVSDQVAHVVLDGPGPMNALDLSTATELRDAATALADHDDVRCIAITGEEGAFSAGANLMRFDGTAEDASRMRRLVGTLHDAVAQFHTAEVPVVTGVNGVAAGAGFGLAIMGDLVLVSDDARFEFAYPRIALVADAGATFFLPRVVGYRRAMEIVLRDDPIGPADAVDLGLATETVPHEQFHDRLDEIAHDLAAGPTVAHGLAKRLLLESFDRDFESQLAAEREAMATASRTDDWERGHAAFFEDQRPDFVGE